MKYRLVNRSFILLFYALLILCCTVTAEASEAPGIPGSSQDHSGESTRIEVGIWLIDIDNIDSVNQSFAANVFIMLRWKDPDPPLINRDNQKLSLNEVWHPNIIIANESGSVQRSFPEVVEVDTDGFVTYRQRYVGTFSQPLDLKEFPFDRHTFSIQLVAQGFKMEEVEFVPLSKFIRMGIENGAGIAREISLPDWSIIEHRAGPYPYKIMPSLSIPGYRFQFTAKRDSEHYIWKVIFPLILIVGMSWAVFWIHPSNSSTQISLSVTSMLTLIAYRFAIDLLVPKVAYMTRLDKFILTATILVFLTLIQANITGHLYANNRTTAAVNIDRWCRVLFPAVFIFTIWFTLVW